MPTKIQPGKKRPKKKLKKQKPKKKKKKVRTELEDKWEKAESIAKEQGFKKDSDDIRDSLVPKLVRYLEKSVPKEIIISDPNLNKQNIQNLNIVSIEKLIKHSDIIIIAVNHSKFYNKNIFKKIKKNTLIVDLWNCFGTKKFIFKK